MKKPVRIVLIVLAVLLCAGAVVLNVPWRYSARFDALEIDLDDPDYLRHTEITADGRISLNLFAQSYFTGAVTVEGYPETFDAAEGYAVFLPPGYALLTYKLRRVQNESGTWEYDPLHVGTALLEKRSGERRDSCSARHGRRQAALPRRRRADARGGARRPARRLGELQCGRYFLCGVSINAAYFNKKHASCFPLTTDRFPA